MSDYISKQEAIDSIVKNVIITTEEGLDLRNEIIELIKELPAVDEKEIIRKPFERVVEELKKEVMIEDSLSKNSTGEIKKMHTYGRNCLNVAIKKIKECGINE